MLLQDDPKLRELLMQAADLPPEDRSAFLERACGDEDSRAEIQSLLEALEDESAEESELPRPSVPSRIGRYTILEKIGEGGMGAVYRARQERPVRRQVALKIIKLGMDTEQVVARFQAERQALALMEHAHIARVYDAGSTDRGRPYFVMELVDGVPITRYCDEHQFTIRQRLGLFAEVCQAVQHAHTKGIIHRDLKPSNVLVANHDGVAVPKIIDFGIAKATQGRLTEQSFCTGQQHWLGTPHYMSPEQAEGDKDIDTRSDIFSLGVLLYELLTGKTPFAAHNAGTERNSSGSTRLAIAPSAIGKIAFGRNTDPQKLRRLMGGELNWITGKCLEQDRARRYESAAGLAADVRRYLCNEPVTARKPGRLYRLRKLVRRNRLAFAAAAALLLALVVGLALTTWSLQRVRVLRDDAELRSYVSDMNLIQQALATNNLGRARQLLNAHRPKPGERDLRGWEWRYLWQQCRSDDIGLICRRTEGINSLSVSYDGRWVAVGEYAAGGLTVWDRKTHRLVAQLAAGEGAVRAAFSPVAPLLAFSANFRDSKSHWHNQLHLWDLGAGRERIVGELNERCLGLAFSRDGQTVITSTWGPKGQVTRWPISAQTISAGISIAAPQTNWVESPAAPFAVADDLSVAAVSPEETLKLIDAKTGLARWSKPCPQQSISSAALSPDGKVLAYALGDKMDRADTVIHLVDATDGKPLGPPLEGHTAWVGALVFWPDGKTLASASADQTIRLWDIRNPANPQIIGRPLRGNTQEVWRLTLLPDNKTLVSGSKDGSVFLWDVASARADPSYRVIKPFAWDFDPSGTSLITLDSQGRVWRLSGRRLSEPHLVMDLGERVDKFTLTDRGRRLAVGYADGRHKLWNLESRTELHPAPQVAVKSASFAAVTPERHLLLYFGDDNTAIEWDPFAGREVKSWQPEGNVSAYAFTPDGCRRVALAYRHRGVFTDASTGLEKPLFLDAKYIDDAAFSPDGTLLALTGDMGTVPIWKTADLANGGNVPPHVVLTGLMLGVHSVAFSPDGKRVVAGDGGAEALKLWDLESRQEVLNLAADGMLFEHIQFSADGNALAAGNENLHLWFAPTLAEISAAEAQQHAESR